MKTIKKFTAFILSVIMLISVLSVGITAYPVTTVKKTMMQYTAQNLTFSKPESAKYKCSVTNNTDKYISVDANNEGSYYWLMVRSKKATPKNKKPVITIYSEKDGKKTNIKKFQITVTAAKKIEMANVKVNKGVEKEIKLNNPYEKEYRLEYNKKIVDIRQRLYDGDKEYHTVIAKKKGKTTVKAYLTGTKKLIGSFTINVGDFKATIKKSYQERTIYYNKHINSNDLIGGSMVLVDAISNYHTNSVYTVTLSNTKTVGTSSEKYYGLYVDIKSKFAKIYSKKTGKVTLTVYEKRGSAKKKKIGTIKLTVKQAKDNKVYASYRNLDNDGIFYENFISPGESFDLKSVVVKKYLNPAFVNKKYHFKASEYTFTAKSARPDIISVDKNGVCHCKAFYYGSDKGAAPKITYTINFKDGSKATGSGYFDIVDEDFFN